MRKKVFYLSKSKAITNFTTGNVTRQLVTFSAPIFFSNLLQAVYSMVDTMIIGRFVGSAGLSGVAIGGDILNFLTFLAVGFATASQVLISQYIGAQKQDEIGDLIGTIFSFLMTLALMISGICLFLREPILNWMSTPLESRPFASVYLTTIIFGLVFIFGYNIVSAIFRGFGDAKRPFLFVAMAAVLNIILDFLFVVGLNMNTFGAALATVISQGFSFLLGLFYLYKMKDEIGFNFKLKNFRLKRAYLQPLISLGTPMAFEAISVQFSVLFVNSWINSYGVMISAVSAIGHKLGMIGNFFANAITLSASSMIGQNIGARKYDRVPRIIRDSFMINAFTCSFLIFSILLFPGEIFGLFTDDPEILQIAMQYVPIAVLIFSSAVVRSPINALIRGTGNYRLNFAIAIFDAYIARIGLGLLLGLVFGLDYQGFWYGNALAGFVPFIIGGVYFLSGNWKSRSHLIKT